MVVTNVKASVGSGKFILKSEVRVANYLPLGVISHPNQQILGR